MDDRDFRLENIQYWSNTEVLQKRPFNERLMFLTGGDSGQYSVSVWFKRGVRRPCTFPAVLALLPRSQLLHQLTLPHHPRDLRQLLQEVLLLVGRHALQPETGDKELNGAPPADNRQKR